VLFTYYINPRVHKVADNSPNYLSLTHIAFDQLSHGVIHLRFPVLAVVRDDLWLAVRHVFEHVKIFIDAQSISHKVLVRAQQIVILQLLLILVRLFADPVNELLKD
jgi:hypothetical protein